jgi:hypothetical protein
MPNNAGTAGTNKHRAAERTIHRAAIHRCENFRFLTISARLRNEEEEEAVEEELMPDE